MSTKIATAARAGTLAVALGLTACGGGGGGGNRSSTSSGATLASVTAGSNQTVKVGSTVTLYGYAYFNVSSNLNTYAWTLTSKPGGSSAALVSPNSLNPTFTPDVAGIYVASLTASADTGSSTPATGTATVTFTAAQTALQSCPETSGANPGFTLTQYNEIALGMTLDQVNQILGCQNDPDADTVLEGYPQYMWGPVGPNEISISFDPTGTTVTAIPGGSTFKSAGSGI
jgi:hypothetical protein